jgi:hypothetical protein
MYAALIPYVALHVSLQSQVFLHTSVLLFSKVPVVCFSKAELNCFLYKISIHSHATGTLYSRGSRFLLQAGQVRVYYAFLTGCYRYFYSKPKYFKEFLLYFCKLQGVGLSPGYE